MYLGSLICTCQSIRICSLVTWRFQASGPCRGAFPDGLCQRHHAAPELILAAHVHIVLAHEVKLAIGTDPVNRKARGKHLDGSAVAHRERDLARSDQHTSGWIEPEGA